MADRRRINEPSGGTVKPVYTSRLTTCVSSSQQESTRNRNFSSLRKICMCSSFDKIQGLGQLISFVLDLKTGLTPSASGSAYLELEQPPRNESLSCSLLSIASTLKLTCTVHGPRPLPRSSPFAPHISLSTHVKFAPFATEQRRGYLRDAGERDLAVHLETALRGIIIGERWPKSGVEIIVTVLEGDEDLWSTKDPRISQKEKDTANAAAMMSILSGCITIASAAIVDAGIDCIDLISGGLAAVIDWQPTAQATNRAGQVAKYRDGKKVGTIVDPTSTEHASILAVCVVGYLQSRDEITELWIKGDLASVENADQGDVKNLINSAVQAAIGTRLVLVEATRESAEMKMTRAGNTFIGA